MRRMITVMILLATAVGVTGSTAWAIEPAHKLSKGQLKSLIQTAKTPADHLKLAGYYRWEASQLQADVKDHEEMALAYEKHPVAMPKSPTPVDHCRNLVRFLTESMNEATEMADMHEEMAKDVK